MKEHINKINGPSNPGFYDAYKRLGEPEVEILFEKDFTNLLEREVTLSSMERYFINIYDATNPECGYNKRNTSPFTPGAKKIIDEKINEITQNLLDERLKDYEVIKEKLLNKKELLNPAELFFIKEKFREKNAFQNAIDHFDFYNYENNSDYDLEFLIDDALRFIKHIIETDTEKEVEDYINNNADLVFGNINDNTILKINQLGEIVKEYQSLNEVCEELNIVRPDNIRYVLRGRQKMAYNHYWMYKKDYEEKKKHLEKDLFN
ncbi:hypothetical protein [Prevotella sp. ne3005]|uniref:hypothetical protein n=1 Tax=Prevotella sp. ne3005 TaxID=1761887 RepID=UPI000B897AB8|nr:hypothetical protein [Prevotella sp. ne3005]